MTDRIQQAIEKIKSIDGLPQETLDFFELSVATGGFTPKKFIDHAEAMADELRKRRVIDAAMLKVIDAFAEHATAHGRCNQCDGLLDAFADVVLGGHGLEVKDD